MLHPSYTDLIEAVNNGAEENDTPVINSRYSIVMASAKRARQIVDGSVPLVPNDGVKPLSTAVDEIYKGKIQILSDETEE